MNRWTLTARGRTKAARKRKSSKKHASSARKLESSEKKRAPGRPRPRPARASNKNAKKTGASNENTKKTERPARDYHAAPCKNHQTAKKKALQGGVEPVPSQHNCPGRVALANQPSRCLCYYAPVPVFIRGKHGKITPNKSLFGKRNSVLNDL